jgi:hypothetical protein
MVDHHCFFFFEGPKIHIHHSSFEVHDFDIQLLGHNWLVQKGYENNKNSLRDLSHLIAICVIRKENSIVVAE